MKKKEKIDYSVSDIYTPRFSKPSLGAKRIKSNSFPVVCSLENGFHTGICDTVWFYFNRSLGRSFLVSLVTR